MGAKVKGLRRVRGVEAMIGIVAAQLKATPLETIAAT